MTATVFATLNLLNARASLDERLPLLAAELDRLKPQVLVLQELILDDGGQPIDEIRAVVNGAGLVFASVGERTPGWAEAFASAVVYDPRVFTVAERGVVRQPSAANFRFGGPHIPFAVLRRLGTGQHLVAFSAHLAWGGENGLRRLEAAKAIEEYAADIAARYSGAVTVVAGDLNELPPGEALRYLRGETGHLPGAFYIDAWTWLRPGEAGITQHPTSKYAAETARSVGIKRPELLPKRRLDYVLLRGWLYGALGENPTIDLWGDAPEGPVSDHLGLVFSFEQ